MGISDFFNRVAYETANTFTGNKYDGAIGLAVDRAHSNMSDAIDEMVKEGKLDAKDLPKMNEALDAVMEELPDIIKNNAAGLASEGSVSQEDIMAIVLENYDDLKEAVMDKIENFDGADFGKLQEAIKMGLEQTIDEAQEINNNLGLRETFAPPTPSM